MFNFAALWHKGVKYLCNRSFCMPQYCESGNLFMAHHWTFPELDYFKIALYCYKHALS